MTAVYKNGEMMHFTKHVKIREEKFGTVVFETLREKVFVANESGKNILNLLGKGYSANEIVDCLSKTYRADISKIKDDTSSFINQLKENNIISD